MKKKLYFTMFAGMIILLAASCASAPVKAPNPLDTLDGARAAAQEIRAKALEMKANVAVPLLFTEADNTFSQAKESDDADKTEAAHEGYKIAVNQFTTAYNEAKLKKDAALKLIGTAEQDRRTSEEVLQQLDDAKNDEEGAN